MKLSELIRYRSQLDKLRPRQTHSDLHVIAGPVLHCIENNDPQFPESTIKVQSAYQGILQSFDQFDQAVTDVGEQLQHLIDGYEHQYLSNSYQLYDEDLRHDTPEIILNRRFNLPDNVISYLQSRIQRYSDWHRAGMIIRPGKETWIQDLVALDPMYLVDTDHNLLHPCMEGFPVEYQRRLRTYVIEENTDTEMLERLPNGQFGFCLAYNFFHHKPFEIIRGYLNEIYDKLAPGGVLGMTFNDCDRRGAVELAERHFMCYTPGSMIKAWANNLGFDVLEEYQVDQACTWLELIKPGNSNSLKGGQALARIMAKPVKQDVDLDANRVYNEEEIKSLRQQASDLNIPDQEKYTPRELHCIVELQGIVKYLNAQKD